MKNSKNLRKWLDDMDLSHPILIAGPCSAETEDQVLDIAHQLKHAYIFFSDSGGNLNSLL